MIETLFLSIIAFIGTNIDDLFINAILFAEAANDSERRHIFFGKYLGIGLLILFSLFGTSGLHFLPFHLLGWLGFIPIGLGIAELCHSHSSNDENTDKIHPAKTSSLLLYTAGITVANGADNIGVYVPLFAGFTAWQIATAVCVFFLFTGIWCTLGKIFSDQPALRHIVEKHRSFLVPTVYIALGVYILIKNGFFG